MAEQRRLGVTALLYAFSGATAFAVHLAVMAILIDVFGVDAVWASGAGFFAAIPVNFAIQRSVVFRSDGAIGRQFAVYLSFTLFFAVVNVVLFYLIWPFLDPYYVIAQTFVTGVIAVMNFIVNRYITFAERSS